LISSNGETIDPCAFLLAGSVVLKLIKEDGLPSGGILYATAVARTIASAFVKVAYSEIGELRVQASL
jgi:hypothetical protein